MVPNFARAKRAVAVANLVSTEEICGGSHRCTYKERRGSAQPHDHDGARSGGQYHLGKEYFAGYNDARVETVTTSKVVSTKVIATTDNTIISRQAPESQAGIKAV